MINIVVKLIMILAVVYVAFFNFDTSKLNDAIKYSFALAWTYPARATIVAIMLAIVVICSWKVYQFMSREAQSVERFSKRWTVGGISDARGLLETRKLLREPNILARNDKVVLNGFLVRYRKIYDALPESIKAKQQNNNLRLHHKSQFFLLRIKPLQDGLLFIINDDGAPDGCVRITDHTAIPTMDEVKQIIGTSVPEKQINLAIESVTKSAAGEWTIHNPKGYGGFYADLQDVKKWSCWFLPIPLGHQYRSIIIDNLELEGLL